MALPKLLYTPSASGITIAFPEGIEDLGREGAVPVRKQNRTAGGVVLTHFEHFKYVLDARIEKMAKNTSFLDALVAFWGWAGKGGAFAFGLDSAKVFESTLASVHTAGNVTITHNATATWPEVVPGARFMLESVQDGWEREVLTVAGVVTADESFTISAGLIYSYVTSDRLRALDWYPKCVALQDEAPIIEERGNLVSFRLRFETFEDIENA